MSDQNNSPETTETAEDVQPPLDKVKAFVKRYDIELAVAAYGLFTLRLASKIAKASKNSKAMVLSSVLEPITYDLHTTQEHLRSLLDQPGSQLVWDTPGARFLLDVVE